MNRAALVLSPHLDDAAFSCGGTLAILARLGWRVVLATLFTRSVPNPEGFALACQRDKGLADDVDYMALRRREDDAAGISLGVSETVHVVLPEAPHRGYTSAPALFGSLHPSDDIGPALVETLLALVTAHRPDLILAPQAIGGHVDHVQVVRAVQVLGHAPVLWWRDFPYVARDPRPKEPFRVQMEALPERIVGLDAAASDAKEAGCLAYASQLGFQFGGAEGLRGKLAAVGRSEAFRGIWPIGTGLPFLPADNQAARSSSLTG